MTIAGKKIQYSPQRLVAVMPHFVFHQPPKSSNKEGAFCSRLQRVCGIVRPGRFSAKGKLLSSIRGLNMVKLSAELVEQAAQYTNPVRDRELDLRG